MNLRIVRAVIAIATLTLAMVLSVAPDFTGRSDGSPTSSHDLAATRRPDTTVFAQDDGDNDESDDDKDEDNDASDDADNDDSDDDEQDNDDADDDCDDVDDNEEDEDDNVDCDEDDDGDNDEDNDGGDEDNEDADNADADDADNEGEVDEEEAVEDEEDGEDDVASGASLPTRAGRGGPPCAPGGIVSTVPDAEVQAVTTGRDLWLALPGDRVSVQAFADTPAGICLVLRLVEPLDHPTAPGVRVGSYIFQVEAFDELGNALETLPAQVSVNVNYAAPDIAGLDERFMTLSRLDPFDQSWRASPGVLLDPVTDWVWVLTTDTGIFVAHVP